MVKIVREPARRVGWTPISKWINPPPFGINSLHCIEFPLQMSKFLLNLALDEPLDLVQKFPLFDNTIKLNLMLASALELCVYDLISVILFDAVRVDICQCQLFVYL